MEAPIDGLALGITKKRVVEDAPRAAVETQDSRAVWVASTSRLLRFRVLDVDG